MTSKGVPTRADADDVYVLDVAGLEWTQMFLKTVIYILYRISSPCTRPVPFNVGDQPKPYSRIQWRLHHIDIIFENNRVANSALCRSREARLNTEKAGSVLQMESKRCPDLVKTKRYEIREKREARKRGNTEVANDNGTGRNGMDHISSSLSESKVLRSID
jgi:hypothetical protein